MSYTDLRDFEAEYRVTSDSGLVIEVEKLGGGTVGREYMGTWRYIVSDASGNERARGQDCESHIPMTHAEVAGLLAAYFETEG